MTKIIKKTDKNDTSTNNASTEQFSFFEDFELDERKKASTDAVAGLTEKQDYTYPLQLVQDFEKFVQCIGKHQIKITKTKGHISRKYLPDINKHMSVQNETATANTEQRYYPYIHFLYVIALKGRILEIDASQKVLKENADRLTPYEKLSNLEKYFFLLETFWVDVDWEDLQSDSHISVPVSEAVQDLFLYFLDKRFGDSFPPKRFADMDERFLFSSMRNWNNFHLYFEWLGLWKCETDQEAIDQYYRKKHYFVKAVHLTHFGHNIIQILLLERNVQFWNTPLRWEHGEVNPTPGTPLKESIFDLPEEVVKSLSQVADGKKPPLFLQSFKKQFPEGKLQETLPRKQTGFVDGIYTFRAVHSKRVWRSLVLSGKHTMEQLHDLIIESYGFDEDHLYSFFMDGKKWSRKSIVSPLDDFGSIQANEIRIGDVGFIQGQSFLYLYDYGDEWSFIVEVKQINAENETKAFAPYVNESVGVGPEQYMDWGW